MVTEIEKRKLPEGWKWVRLGEVCEINPKRDLNIRDDNAPTTFIPMQAIDDRKGVISSPKIKPYSEIKKGYTFFRENDVLFAKITPCMQNGKHAVAINLIDKIGFGSTEFHVIRPTNRVISDWIHAFVRQPSVLKGAMSYFTGAVGQQRVPASFLENLQIPLPPLSEQKRIVAILKEQMAALEKAKSAAEAQLGAVKALPAAYLREVFARNKEGKLPEGWKWVRLGEVCEIKGGKRLPKGTEFTKNVTPYPYIRVVDFKSGTINTNGLKYITEEIRNTISKYSITKYDIYVSIAGTIGIVGTVPPELDGANLTENAARMSIKDKEILEKEYVWLFLASPEGQAQIKERTNIVGQPKLALERIGTIQLPIPPLSEQKRIVAILKEKIEEAKKLCKALEEQLETINKLPAALLQRAFRGKL